MSIQRGFSLVEALVALVILSIGLIGMAAMQLKAVHSASDGYQKTLASVAALDAQERLWAAYQASPHCADLALSQVERAWQRHWFHESEAVLGEGKAFGDIKRQGCGFVITVTHAAHASRESEVYRFQLPSRL
ncbi:type IV pilus modification protein PilV [Vreelandella sp. EE22]